MTSVKQELPSGNAESAAMNSNAIWRAHHGEVTIRRAQLDGWEITQGSAQSKPWHAQSVHCQ
ncbi:hypothetical protein K0M31_009661 [Melipona bicolor]|uniref:Uncharacterized protein n=1 Tax=Melipona bicolor TaxID=60889 RepID=A0AA40FPI1_9HYME|nr:hypothetical protein K0M31_009661 [Melipona bicolor]